MHDVHAFSPDVLQELCLFPRDESEIRDYPLRGSAAVASKRQLTYISGYLGTLDCRTIVAESDYVDHDFLDDFASYYAKCYQGYSRKCLRLHFFSCSFSAPDYEGFLKSRDRAFRKLMKKNYLGFMVAKPLPDAFVGRTCIKTYPREKTRGERRNYMAAYECEAHLAGVTLSVESLPFQEQDAVVAACATTAVWSALQRTSNLFKMASPTPSKITALATEHGQQRSRVLPSQGLELGQMCRTLISCGLEVEVREGDKLHTDDAVKELIYAYGSLGLPAILGIQPLQDPSDERHAVTVAGYSLPRRTGASEDRKDLSLVSHAITRIYVHDDQRGPFVSSEFPGLYSPSLSARRDEHAEPSPIFALLTPVYPKIRIRYESAKDQVINLDTLLRAALGQKYTWDIRLCLGYQAVAEIAELDGVAPTARLRILQSAYPRFVWQANALIGREVQLSVLMDATDIERSFFVFEITITNAELLHAVRELLRTPELVDRLTQDLPRGDAWISKLRHAAHATGS